MQQLAGKYLHSPDMIDMVGADDIKIPVTIQHWSFAAQRETRSEILGLIATMYGSDKRSMIFTQVRWTSGLDEFDVLDCQTPCTSVISALISGWSFMPLFLRTSTILNVKCPRVASGGFKVGDSDAVQKHSIGKYCMNLSLVGKRGDSTMGRVPRLGRG